MSITNWPKLNLSGRTHKLLATAPDFVYKIAIHVFSDEGDLTWMVWPVREYDLCGAVYVQRYTDPTTNTLVETYNIRKVHCAESHNFICYLQDSECSETCANFHV